MVVSWRKKSTYGANVRFDGFLVVLASDLPSNLFAARGEGGGNKLEGKWMVPLSVADVVV